MKNEKIVRKALLPFFLAIGCGTPPEVPSAEESGAQGEGGGSACTVGTEGCSCFDGRACESGLTCISGVCVDLDEGRTSGEGPGGSGSGSGVSSGGGSDDGGNGSGDDGSGGFSGGGEGDNGEEGEEADDGGTTFTRMDLGEDEECDIWNDRCPRGFKCMPVGPVGSPWDRNECVPLVDNPDGLGDKCEVFEPDSRLDSCEKGSICFPETGICNLFCRGDIEEPFCSDRTDCVIFNGGVAPVCLDICHPRYGDDCQRRTHRCTFAPSVGGFVCAGDESGGRHSIGASCERFPECNPGMFCINGDYFPGGCPHEGCCTWLCDVNDERGCESLDESAECVSLGLEAFLYNTLGVCVDPG